jgi:hypothetical protein
MGLVGRGTGGTAHAIAALRPTFLRHPQAVMHWMAPMWRQFLERCGRLGVEPDGELLGPIAQVLQRLEAHDGDT